MVHDSARLDKAELFQVIGPDTRGVIVHGRKDEVVPVSHSRRLAESIPDEYRSNWEVVFSEDGHMLFYTATTATFNTWIDFVTGESTMDA